MERLRFSFDEFLWVLLYHELSCFCNEVLLKIAFENSKINNDAAFKAFVEDNSDWGEDYALYMAVKADNDNKAWSEWSDDLKHREKAAIDEAKKKFKDEILFYEFLQYEFLEEWKALKR